MGRGKGNMRKGSPRKIMGYKEPKEPKNCGRCRHSEVTNPGAYIPGLRCLVMAKIYKRRKKEFGNCQVDLDLGTCRLFNMKWPEINKILKGPSDEGS